MVVTNWIIYIYAVVFSIYAYFSHPILNPLLLILSCSLFLVSLREHRLWAMPWVRLLILCCFHWTAQLNLALPLYLLLLSRDIYTEDSTKKSWSLAASFALVYMTTAFYTSEDDSIHLLWLFVLSNSLHFVAAVILTKTSFMNLKQTELLRKERALLSKQDSLTGLYNFEECHRRLEQLIEENRSLVLILIDCNDLKSMNTARGFQAGNFILKQIAELLKILFSDALFISRYGGDEFAVVMPYMQNKQAFPSYKLQLDSELPKLTGIQITYGIATYPSDGVTKDDLILLAEHNLFIKKRETWLKREEHMLRSEKLRVVGELASGMAHEIRNPLTTVRGFLQISKANGYNIENWYSMIMDEIDRMSELTAEFLQFSKPHSTQFRIHSLHECILKVISLMESEATRLGHQIHYSESFLPVPILMDQDKMIQLLLNLLKNACEAMEETGVIQIKLTRDQKHATLVIEDNGPGIPSELLEKIFHPFYTTKESGTGLGLSICHKIVQDHEGTLEVESAPHRGARFIITFPLSTEELDSSSEKSRF
ncbi:diguanylate cyclase [Paenibacillus sp. SYP-B3998]|uniref:histidine kinase n=1 Tax=Paenibacillus sp. SYP-B3998 TaxID=2678564 RepID=A0A6G3ZTA7_9BACL|nr:ATP-binding protein [Paenibacillus sp. SYP-B3998]NEW05372.1 diguanylate cyclase [Paenibacillus sp. SYP-B3998]